VGATFATEVVHPRLGTDSRHEHTHVRVALGAVQQRVLGRHWDTADQKAGRSGAVRAQVPWQAGHRKRTVRSAARIATAYGMPGTSLQCRHDAPTPWGVETGTPALTETGHAESVAAGIVLPFYRWRTLRASWPDRESLRSCSGAMREA